MDSVVANRLAAQITSQAQPLCQSVAGRLLSAYPELNRSLRLEESYSPVSRMSEVAVERLSELVRSVLLFEAPALADGEFQWASRVLPRSGVTYEHQATLVRWFFDELRRLPLDRAEASLSRELETYFLAQIRSVYN